MGSNRDMKRYQSVYMPIKLLLLGENKGALRTTGATSY